MPKDVKNVADSYKSSICNGISQLISQNKPREHLLLGYAHVLRHYLGQKEQDEKITQLLQHLDAYVTFALKKSQNFHTAGYLNLFITILQNKSKIPEFEETLAMRFWNACKDNLSVYSRFEEYAQLIVLIIGHVSNEGFSDVMRDLLDISVRITSFYCQNVNKEFNYYLNIPLSNLRIFCVLSIYENSRCSFQMSKIFHKHSINHSKH